MAHFLFFFSAPNRMDIYFVNRTLDILATATGSCFWLDGKQGFTVNRNLPGNSVNPTSAASSIFSFPLFQSFSTLFFSFLDIFCVSLRIIIDGEGLTVLDVNNDGVLDIAFGNTDCSSSISFNMIIFLILCYIY